MIIVRIRPTIRCSNSATRPPVFPQALTGQPTTPTPVETTEIAAVPNSDPDPFKTGESSPNPFATVAPTNVAGAAGTPAVETPAVETPAVETPQAQDPADWSFLQEHIPWSRNLALLDPEQLQAVRSRPDDYVLKRPLDTRGQGVVVGRGTTPEEWAQAVKVAQDEAWLVQGFHDTSWVERDFEGTAFNRHDIALGAINGELTTIFARSSAELRVNMARTGRMHPVYLGR